MITILVDIDNYMYITSDDVHIFNLLKKSFTRIVKKYNNYYRMYEEKQHLHYTLVDNGTVIKTKAGLLDFLCTSLHERNIKYVVNDKRDFANINNYSVKFKLSDDVILKDYQIDAVNSIIRNCFCCVQLPTGSGKTEVSASVLDAYLKTYLNTAALYVVPTIKLQEEAKERFEKYGIKTNRQLPIKISCVNILTYATLVRSKIDYKQKDLVGCLIFDEQHHLKADKSSKIIHQYKRLKMCVGLSATITNNIENKNCLHDLDDDDFNVLGCTGKPVYYKIVKDSINEGNITPIKVSVLNNSHLVYLNDDDCVDWLAIKRKIIMSNDRISLVAKYVKYLFDNSKGNLNTLCLLIPEINMSNMYMQEIYNNLKNDDIKIYLLYGGNRYATFKDDKLVTLNDTEKKEAENNIKNPNIKTVFSATSFFKEGIDIKNMQALINVCGGKSTTATKQTLGRVVRLFKGKKKAFIYEINDQFSIVLKKQLEKRLTVYEKEYNAEVVYSKFREGD